jgi:Fe-S-cluster containining protein
MKTHNIYDQLNEKIENHYFSELYKRQDCPFLNSDKGCSIYPVRPMVCRMFGHSSKKDHEASYQGILEMNEEADAYFFETYQKHIPDEVKFHKIDYCQSFKPSKVMSKSSRQELIDHLFQLDTQFLFEDLIPEDAINLSITNWFIYLKYSEEEASEKRIKMFLENCK